MRRFHRWFGLLSAGFVLLTVITGLLWAYAPHLYWMPGYKEKKSEIEAPKISDAKLSIRDVLRCLGREDDDNIQSVILRRDFGRLLYEVRGSASVLIDAISGQILSPLDEVLVREVARQHIPGGFTLEGVQFLDSYTSRDGKKFGATALVRFKERGTEIIIDRNAGNLIEDQDRVRRFHFWIMRLHRLEFFGFKKELTILPGLSIVLMLSSGFLIFRKIKSARRFPSISSNPVPTSNGLQTPEKLAR